MGVRWTTLTRSFLVELELTWSLPRSLVKSAQRWRQHGPKEELKLNDTTPQQASIDLKARVQYYSSCS